MNGNEFNLIKNESTLVESMSNKTLNSPIINTTILDSNSNELIKFSSTPTAVNEITVANSRTGVAPSISATGGDTNINLSIVPKGTGKVIASTGLGVNTSTFLTGSPFAIAGTANSYIQSTMQNTSNGASASGDLVVTADTGTDTTNYIDMGINSSGYNDATFSITGALDGYLYSNGGNLSIGTATPTKTIKFFTGGTLAANERMRITDTAVTVGGNSVASYLTASTPYDPGSVVAGTPVLTTITVTGAALGDHALASLSVDLQGLNLNSYVSNTNTVTCVLSGNTSTPVDLASSTLKVKVFK